MMKWVETALWAWCRIVGTALQLVGFTGILAMCIWGIWMLAGKAVAPLHIRAGATSPRWNPKDSRGAAGACAERSSAGAGRVSSL